MTAVLIRTKEGNSLVIQWLRFHASIAGGMGLIPGWRTNLITWVFPDSSVGKESACNAGDPGWIPGLGRSAGEGIGYPIQYSWASLVAQLVKNQPAMWETWVWSLSWKDPLEKGKATHFSILAWRIPRTEEAGGYSPGGRKKVKHIWACTQVLTPLVAGSRSRVKLQQWLSEPQVGPLAECDTDLFYIFEPSLNLTIQGC